MSNGLDVDEEDEIQLLASDGKIFKINKSACLQSNLMKTTLQDKDTRQVSLIHIESDIMAKVVEYLNYHANTKPREIQTPLISTNMKDLVDTFDAGFTDTNQEIMFKLMLAANYMDIESLILLMCAKCATLMKGKNPDQIRSTFHIRSDYTKEEENEVRRNYSALIE